ncbi:hypothetical protein FRC96_05600 [Lujinxingia vulgaris]|uniref:Uncharacterized protein n=1 Tax=Lujinxingia vulgaris TaxID=2600176 RepID=A0A5C6XPV2_9DELT|nr:hypothetical protein [Lujinxingia vulgaris]TXD39748.1 hypothetical protein FRC96_05600 [Lujinxingia vulgaris]
MKRLLFQIVVAGSQSFSKSSRACAPARHLESSRTCAPGRHYEGWYGALVTALRDAGWRIAPGDLKPVRVATLFAEGRQHELAWSFDAALERYILTMSSPPWPTESGFSGGARRRLVGRSCRVETFTRLLAPTPAEGLDEDAIARLVEALDGASPRAREDARPFWEAALSAVGNGGVEWLSEHKARVVVPRGERAHQITLYAYESGVRIVGVVAAIDDLGFRTAWGGPPNLDRVRDWALDATNELALGYLDVHERDSLVFGVHVLHGTFTEEARRRLVVEVAWRADV